MHKFVHPFALFYHFFQSLCQLIRAAGRFASASNPFDAADDLFCLHALDQCADTLQVAVTASNKDNILDDVVVIDFYINKL